MCMLTVYFAPLSPSIVVKAWDNGCISVKTFKIMALQNVNTKFQWARLTAQRENSPPATLQFPVMLTTVGKVCLNPPFSPAWNSCLFSLQMLAPYLQWGPEHCFSQNQLERFLDFCTTGDISMVMKSFFSVALMAEESVVPGLLADILLC